MRSFGEFKDRTSVEEKLVPEIREILAHIEQALKVADSLRMKKTIDALEDVRQEIISLEGK
jgi:hypothetical protein